MTLIEFSRKALTVPFVKHGRSWDGWDCWGMVNVAYRELRGVELPSFAGDYPDAGDTREGRACVEGLIRANMGDWRKVSAPEPGDVVLLKIGGRPIHVGLMVGQRAFLHTEKKIGTVIERTDGAMWRDRIDGVYRLA